MQKIGMWGEKMTVNEIPNINNCTIEEIGSPAFMYRITSNEGWYIHLNDSDEVSANHYKTCVILRTDYDFSIVQILPESELPEGAEILGGNTEPDHEVM